MKKFSVTALQGVTISSGILDLTAEQARRRSGCIADLGEGLFKVTSPVMFKCGETFGFDGDINKSLMEELTVPEIEVPAAEAEPDAGIKAEIEKLRGEMKAAPDKGAKAALAGVIASLEKKLAGE